MSGPEYNPMDEQPIDREAYEQWEKTQQGSKPTIEEVETTESGIRAAVGDE